jgi:hypothetical protein
MKVMAFSPDEVREILSALGSLCKEAVAQDKRRAVRKENHAVVTIVPLSESGAGQEILVALQDVSQRGIGFIHWQQFPAGQKFLLRLPVGDQIKSVPAVVVNSRAEDDGSYRMGAEFQQVLQEVA